MRLLLQEILVRTAEFAVEIDEELHAHVTAIFGSSGAGKTTLLDAIAGLRRPARGVIRLGERTLNDCSARIFVPPYERRIGYVPQDLALFRHLSVRDNLLYGHREGPAREGGLRLTHVVDMLDIGGLLKRRIGHLSGGEKQRVALGRAILCGPRLLLLDEPLASLDAALKQRILPYLRRVRDTLEIPIVYVSHDPGEVTALCDDALVLESGRVLRRGPPGQVLG